MTSPRQRPELEDRYDPASVPVQRQSREQGSLVVVREHVVGEIAHELGNFFHKLYYWADYIKSESDVVKRADSTVGHMLERTVASLDEFLKTTLDYFTPITLNPTNLRVDEVVEGFLTQLRSLSHGSSILVTREELVSGTVLLVDPTRVSQAFRNALHHIREDLKAGVVVVTVGRESRGDLHGVEIRLELESKSATPSLLRGSELGVEWAVAAKLIELHGGDIIERDETNGCKVVAIFLPIYN